jgi:hypothetical protein
MGFKWYTGKQYSRIICKGPAVTITKYGLINLNRTAMEQAGLGWKYTQFAFDRTTGQLAVKFGADATAQGAHKVCTADKGGVRIGAKEFLRWAGLDFSETRTFSAADYDKTSRTMTVKLSAECFAKP